MRGVYDNLIPPAVFVLVPFLIIGEITSKRATRQGSAAFGFFLTIYAVLAPAVVGCAGCTYRQQQPVAMVPGFRIAGWIAYGFAVSHHQSLKMKASS